MEIIKRDGRKVDFDGNKIKRAIERAFNKVQDQVETQGDREQLIDGLVKDIEGRLIGSGTQEFDIGYIQDLVEGALIEHKLTEVAREYIQYRTNRTRVRESNSSIMQKMNELTFGSAKDVELKRENGNIDGDTSMGTMLRYGTEIAKTFNFNTLTSPEVVKAHRQGDIHIHDADFMSLTMTCLVGNTNITITDRRNEHQATTMAYFDQYYSKSEEGVKDLSRKGVYIQEKNGRYTKVINCSRRKLGIKEKLYKVEVSDTEISLTGEHRVPITEDITCKNSSNDFLYQAKDINTNVYLYRYIEKGVMQPQKVKSVIQVTKDTDTYVYDIETTTNYYLANGLLVHNCCQIDLKKLFNGGFSTGHGNIREPGEIRSYAALACIAIQSNQNDMHGGQAIPHFDYYMAPGVSKTYIKKINEVLHIRYSLTESEEQDIKVRLKDIVGQHITKGISLLDNLDEVRELLGTKLEPKEVEKVLEIATEMTQKEVYQAMEALVHNLNTMQSRAGSQVPFSSINYGTDTTTEGRMVTRNLLLATDRGLGGGETPIFPVQIFKIKEGINYNPQDKNYDLFKLSCEVSAKRLYPNYANLDAPYNKQYYQEGKIDTEIAYMGCVRGAENIHYKLDNEPLTSNFRQLWEMLSKNNIVQKYGITEYIEPSNLLIKDSYNKTYTRVIKLIKNPNKNNWYNVKFTHSKCLIGTSDHPLPIKVKGRTYLKDIKVGDIGYSSNEIVCSDGTKTREIEVLEIAPIDFQECSYDVETETDRFDVSGIQSHNCRTRVVSNTYDKTREQVTSRGNLSFTSINLPRIALEVSQGKYDSLEAKIDAFYSLLGSRLDLVHKQLLDRLAIQSKKTVKNFPFLMGQGVWLDSEKLSETDTIAEIIKHGSLSVGFIGLAETLKCLTGEHHGESSASQKLGLEIVGYMRDKMDEWSEEEQLNYGLIGTPAEGLSGRFVNIDKERFGVVEGVTDREYYTNSSHVPVYYNISIVDKLKIEAPYHELENAGHIAYIEVDGDISRNIPAFERIVRLMHDNNIGYGAINHPVDYDPICGYTGIIGDTCPRCGRKSGEGIPMQTTKAHNEHGAFAE